jgi:hypothetical protein
MSFLISVNKEGYIQNQWPASPSETVPESTEDVIWILSQERKYPDLDIWNADQLIWELIDPTIMPSEEVNALLQQRLTENIIEQIRYTRHYHISDSDWTQLADSPLSEEEKAAWSTYRQELRDLTANVEDLSTFEAVVWPSRPDGKIILV